MIQAIAATLPIITGIMISPIPVAGLIVVLTSKRGQAKSIAYGMGFFTALWLPTFLLALLGQKTIAVPGSSGAPSKWSVAVYGGVGVLFLFLAAVAFVKRPGKTSQATEPGWMKTIDSASMRLVFGFGMLLFLNPKNVPLLISAAVDYAQAGLSTVQLAIVVTVFTLMGSLLILLPIVLARLARESSAKLFDKLRPWLVAHNVIILTAIFVIMGIVMLGKAFAAAF